MKLNNFGKAEFTIVMNNVPDYINEYNYIIGRFADGGFWYYGADNDYDKCKDIAREIGNGFVIENK